MLAAEAQHHLAGHQALQARAGRQQLRHQRGRRHHLLEVVEHQQHLLVPGDLQAVEQHLARFFWMPSVGRYLRQPARGP